MDLSRLEESELCVDDLIEGESLETSMTRAELEMLAAHVLDRCATNCVCVCVCVCVCTRGRERFRVAGFTSEWS